MKTLPIRTWINHAANYHIDGDVQKERAIKRAIVERAVSAGLLLQGLTLPDLYEIVDDFVSEDVKQIRDALRSEFREWLSRTDADMSAEGLARFENEQTGETE